jgi:hypothetical protein
MPRTSENFSSGWASTDTKILNMSAFIVANGVIVAKVSPTCAFRGKEYSIFVNGIYQGNETCPMKGDWTFSYTLDEGTELGSFYIVESGSWDAYDNENSVLNGGSIPDGWIKEWETTHAKRLKIEWDPEPMIKGIYGDTQLTGVSITGINRASNVEKLTGQADQCRLWYSLTTQGTIHYIQWYADNRLVASGNLVGNGLVTCTEENGSGLNISAILTYTGDLTLGLAWIEISFPASFQIHYSTTPLSYPRTPEDTVLDDGVSNHFVYLSPVLLGTSYNYNVLAVSRSGVVTASTSPPADSPKVLVQGPIGPTITGFTGTAAACTVTWTQGEAGCSYTVCHGFPCEPVNLGDWVAPLSFTRPTGATTAVLPPIDVSAYPKNYEVHIDALEAAITAQINLLNTAYDVGKFGYQAVFDSFFTAIIAAYKVYGNQIECNVQPYITKLTNLELSITGQVASILSSNFTDAQFRVTIAPIQGGIFYRLGVDVLNEPGRWLLSGGTVYPSGPSVIQTSLDDLARPYTRNARVCVIVRATKLGVQEAADNEACVEFDAYGNVIQPRPNSAIIDDYSTATRTISIAALYLSDNEEVSPNYIDMYVVAATNSIDYSVPVSNAPLGSDVNGERRATPTYTVVADGYYKIAVKARVSLTGARSMNAEERIIYVDGTPPDGVINLFANIIRGEG